MSTFPAFIPACSPFDFQCHKYTDNEQDKDLWFIGASVVTFISILPLGFGFIGLLAIHKAIKAEDEVEEAKAERARRRAYRRKLKSQEADSNNESQE